MLTVGLTGGIGCGKTTVTNIFEKLGVPVIDADTISHEIVQAGQPALTFISEKFGSNYLLENGELNRPLLKSHVFSQPEKKKALEAILHPLIFHEINEQLADLTSPYALLSIPLLFETNFQQHVDKIVVIDCDTDTQIKRVVERDKLSPEEVTSIITAQCSRAFRLEHADAIINNDGPVTDLNQQVVTLHNKFLALSASKKRLNPSK